jgi:quercetin dioxygenase-like cupin family protein
MTDGPQIRRVVTGHDDSGHAVILIDDIAPNTFASPSIPGFGAAVPWRSDSTIDHVTDHDPVGAGTTAPSFPTAGQTVFRIAEFPPDADYPDDAQDRIFDEIDGHAEAEDGAKNSGGQHFWFHRTDSLDYAIVLEGEITLLVDKGETTLRAGDVAIQRATSHAWSNRTDRIARVAFVLIGTEPLSAEQIAQARREPAAQETRA